jgi:heat-inducible transcriptional repressor
MSVTDFEQRRNRILELIIEAYVSTASPVGSELVARKLRASLSPATIRNVMGELEQAGYVEQPHTSAGRVPTERGYRFYVDSVMDQSHLSPDELRQLSGLLESAELEPDQLIARSSEVLSELTRQAAFAVAPTVKRSTVKQIELVPLSVRKMLCVLIANEEMIASHIVEIEEPMTRDETAALTRFINTELVGLSFSELLDSLERRMLAETDSFYHFVKRSLRILEHALSTEPDERLLLEGMSHVVSQPEFSRDPHKARELLQGLDAEEALLGRVRQDLGGPGVRVRIGREVQVPGLEECSYIAAPFAVGGEVVGGIGILGPKRMDYQRLAAAVEGMSRCLTGLLSRWNER